MRCDIVKERLSAYMDGELPHSEMQEISIHLEGCESCAKEFESFEELSSSVQNYFQVISNKVSLDSIYDKVMERVEKEGIKPLFKDENEGWFMKFIKSLLQYSPTFASVAAILIIGFALLPEQRNSTENSSKSDSVSVESLEYSKFNAMIYKTKEQNKTVIWLFKQENDDEFDDSI